MSWRCGSKKADGTKCRCSVPKKGAKCHHHKRGRKTARKKTAKKKKKRKKNPLAPFSQLNDRWSLPKLPPNVIR